MQKTIWGFGAATLDFRIQTADYGDGYTEKLLAQQTMTLGGGATANCLVQVARLGGKAAYLGKMGDDWIAGQVLAQLRQEGVDCTRVIRDTALLSPFNLAVYAGTAWRRRGGYLLPNSLNTISAQDIEHFINAMREGDWCLVELGEIPLSVLRDFCQNARGKGIHLVLDVDLDPLRQCGGTRTIAEEIFHSVEYLMPNASALQSLYPGHDAQSLAQILADTFQVMTIVTVGKDGCYVLEPGQSLRHQASLLEEQELVDSVGAGDAFHGGVLYALAADMPLAQSISVGLACAAFNCRTFGAREGMPYAEDIHEHFGENID